MVYALMTVRRVDRLTAITLVAEFGDFRRFAHPRGLMGYLDLVPSERTTVSGGGSERLGQQATGVSPLASSTAN